METFYRLHFKISLLIILFLSAFFSFNTSISFFFGTSIILFDIWTIQILAKYLIFKKRVAWSVITIVFKYPLLGVFFYLVGKLSLVSGLWLGLGVSSLFLTMILYSFSNLSGTKTNGKALSDTF